jgi:hypothetical protein
LGRNSRNQVCLVVLVFRVRVLSHFFGPSCKPIRDVCSISTANPNPSSNMARAKTRASRHTSPQRCGSPRPEPWLQTVAPNPSVLHPPCTDNRLARRTFHLLNTNGLGAAGSAGCSLTMSHQTDATSTVIFSPAGVLNVASTGEPEA